MASTFKPITQNDVVATRTMLHEAIPITGSIPSGTYANSANIKTYTHGMFESVFDYPYLSASANHIFDLTVGYAASSDLSASSNTQNSKKINIYNQMAQILVGHDITGAVLTFDQNGDLLEAGGGIKYPEAIFMSFSRLLVKDEIKKGTFEMRVGVGDNHASPFEHMAVIKDLNAQNDYRVNSPAGEYAVLYVSNSTNSSALTSSQVDEADISTEVQTTSNSYACGLVYYQAGIVVLSPKLFYQAPGSTSSDLGYLSGAIDWMESGDRSDSGKGNNTVSGGVGYAFKNEEITGSCEAFRHRIENIQFNNTTELNSTIYFCRVNHNDFNYSSNPTYLSGSEIRVKNQASDEPVSYITTIGLYSADNELLAVAKLSEPIKKTPSTELNFRVRLDY